MNAHRVEAMLIYNGTLTLRDLPFQAGDTVEVIILARPTQSPPSVEKKSHRRKPEFLHALTKRLHLLL